MQISKLVASVGKNVLFLAIKNYRTYIFDRKHHFQTYSEYVDRKGTLFLSKKFRH